MLLPYKIYIPQSLDGKLTPAQEYFVSLLRSKSASISEPGKNFRPLSSKILRRTLGKNYMKEEIQPLLDSGVLDRRNHIKEIRCRNYALQKPFSSEPVVIKYLSPIIFLKQLEYFRALEKRLDVVESSILSSVRNIRFIPGFNRRVLSKFRKKKAKQKILVEMLQDGNVYFHVDRNDGRIHHLVLTLKSKYRKDMYFTHDNTMYPLYGVDCKNSQPLLFCGVLETHVSALPGLSQEIEVLRAWCEQGVFYDKIFQLMCENPLFRFSNKEFVVVRQRFKKDFFKRIFFCSNDSTKKSSYRTMLKDHFPNTLKILEMEKELDYRLLSMKLRSLESKIWIKGISSRFQKLHPGVPFITVHDSIYTLPDFIDPLQKIVIEVYKEHGFNPSIAFERRTNVNVGPAPGDDRYTSLNLTNDIFTRLELAINILLKCNQRVTVSDISKLLKVSDNWIYKNISTSQKARISRVSGIRMRTGAQNILLHNIH